LINGRAETTYQSADDYSGEVIVTARSGKATISPEQLTITVNLIEEPDIAFLYISADPMDLPVEGGKSKISVLAMDEEMLPVANKNIWLETTAGSLTSGLYSTTDKNGKVQTWLNTTISATVTARYKSLSSSVTITVEKEE
jgi:hypothetical protein